ncbi:MAG: FAD:protein FMN transferase [Kangiellaceae bacterium]|jgi:thiamine biosynthesis lipoprotein|nr:FAD:protein FMN transferase [Kangiellaceae bacterium]
MKKDIYLKVVVISAWLIMLSACNSSKDSNFKVISGFTMGTTYTVKLETKQSDSRKIQQAFDQRLKEINQYMSTYIDDSELMQLNRNNSTGCINISQDTFDVIEESLRLHQLSKGSFDPGLGPLIELWGFDNKETNDQIPSQQQIDVITQQLTFGQSELLEDGRCVSKGSGDLFINLSAIAKGYAVDEIAKIAEQDFASENYMVEIGGEVSVKGVNDKGMRWRIAIESPTSASRSIQRIITPMDMAVATSGDYRNYFEKDGKRYSHTINPVTGYPITHNLASVTVVHPSAMTADGIATAIMVLGPQEGLALAEREKIAVFLIVKQDDSFKEVYNKRFEQFFFKQQPK